MSMSRVFIRTLLPLILVSLMLLPGISEAYPEGIGGEQSNAGETIDDVAKEGCLCHGELPSNSAVSYTHLTLPTKA